MHLEGRVWLLETPRPQGDRQTHHNPGSEAGLPLQCWYQSPPACGRKRQRGWVVQWGRVVWGGGSWSLGREDVKCEVEVAEPRSVCQGDSHPGSPGATRESAGEICFRGCSGRNARSIRECLAIGKTILGLLSSPHGALDMIRAWGCLGVPGRAWGRS